MTPLRGFFILFLLLISPSDTFCQPLGRVRVVGNFSLSTDQIRNQMTTKEDHWWSNHHFDQRTLGVDLIKISALYHRYGFLAAKVKADTSRGEGEKIDLTIAIHEGPQTLVSEIEISDVTNLAVGRLPRIMATKVGDPLSVKGLEEDKEMITAFYADNGYPYAQVEPSYQLSPDSSWAKVLFQIGKGPLVRYGKIEVKGVKSVREHLVRRELTIRPGALYRHSQIEESQQRIYSTGLFNYVRIYAQNPFENPDFTVSVMERESRWFGLRTGLGQDEQYDVTFDLSGEWGTRNIGGGGRKLILSTTLRFQVLRDWANLKNRFAVTYTEPWFLNIRAPLSLELHFDPGVKERDLGYRIQELGGNIDLSYEPRENLILRTDYSYKKVDIFGVSPSTAEEIKEEKGITIRRRIGLFATRDTRDNVFVPHLGSWTQFSSSFVGGFLGGDLNFYRMISSWSRYQRLTKSLILASRLKMGLTWPFGSTKEVPITDRFFTGGGGSIRGYPEKSIGLRDQERKTIGGRVLFVSNLELRFPLFWRLGGTLFLDGGGVWRDWASVSLNSVNLSIGCGVQVFTPVGPLRLDYGQRIISEEMSPGGRFHFSILYCF